MLIELSSSRVLEKKGKEKNTSTVKEPMEVSRVTSGTPPSALAHILLTRHGAVCL